MTIAEVLTIISPIIVIVAAILAMIRWLWQRVEKRLNEGRNDICAKLDAIEQHLIRLNGSRDVHDRQIAKLEGAVFMLEQRQE